MSLGARNLPSLGPAARRTLIANLRGGLGNQLFQYACGRSLARDLDLTLTIATDMLGYSGSRRRTELNHVFQLAVPEASRQDLSTQVGRWRASPRVRLFFEKQLLAWARGPRFAVETCATGTEALPAKLRNGGYLHGYWQSERYFARHAETIRADLAFRQALIGRNAKVATAIGSAPAASIHIRRGDYLAQRKFRTVLNVCPLNYYVDAIELLMRSVPQVRFFAFSDDLPWVKKELQPLFPGLQVVDHNSGYDSHYDMQLMALCDHHIIANSSFSWWAAWLNPSPDKIVVAPGRWYANGWDSTHLTPENWLRL